MKTKYKIIVLGVLFLYSYCAINAQEATIYVKFKSEEHLQSFKYENEGMFLNLESVSQILTLVPRYPDAKWPENKLYYKVKTLDEAKPLDNVTECMRAIEAEDLFSEVEIAEDYPINSIAVEAADIKNAVYQMNGTVFFENREEKTVKLSFYDLSGKLLHSTVTTANSYQPNLAQTGSAILCEVTIDGVQRTIKYIVP